MSTTLRISSDERQQAIVSLLEKEKRISVNDICEEFSISAVTARRDLDVLESNGQIKRIWGGAILNLEAPPEPPILDRESEQTELKVRIGCKAAELIKPGETIFLGSGTTVLAVARQLHNCKDLTVLTNSLPVINLLVGCTGIDLVVFGGVLRESELSFIGHITESALREVRADKVIIGARALHLDEGITNDYISETLTDRAILKIGREVIITADHTKFGMVSTAFLAPLEDVDVIVTDNEISKEYVQSMKEKDIKVILV